MVNAAPGFLVQLAKLSGLSLCANTVGQLALSVMVRPPGTAAYRETCARTLAEMARKAALASDKLNATPHMSCQQVQGAMYAFPKIELPKRFTVQCSVAGRPADSDYVLRLLEATGVCVVSGSGFLQVPGSWHFRMSILEAEERTEQVLSAIQNFH